MQFFKGNGSRGGAAANAVPAARRPAPSPVIPVQPTAPRVGLSGISGLAGAVMIMRARQVSCSVAEARCHAGLLQPGAISAGQAPEAARQGLLGMLQLPDTACVDGPPLRSRCAPVTAGMLMMRPEAERADTHSGQPPSPFAAAPAAAPGGPGGPAAGASTAVSATGAKLFLEQAKLQLSKAEYRDVSSPASAGVAASMLV